MAPGYILILVKDFLLLTHENIEPIIRRGTTAGARCLAPAILWLAGRGGAEEGTLGAGYDSSRWRIMLGVGEIAQAWL